MNRRALLSLSVALVAIPAVARAATRLGEDRTARQWPPVQAGDDGLAVQGHDPVAYFIDGRPVAGDPAHALDWNGATWRFASADNRARFAADPTAYAPQFGGYCAWATSQGYIAPGHAPFWRIVDGHLYLNYSERAQELWSEDIPGAIARGEANWPRVLTENQG